jgi:hypothetical protein
MLEICRGDAAMRSPLPRMGWTGRAPRQIAAWTVANELMTYPSSSGLNLDAISSTLLSWSSKKAAITVSAIPSAAAAHRTDEGSSVTP